MQPAPTTSPEAFFIVVVAFSSAAALAAILGHRGIAIPAVVLELLAGVLIGPHLIGLQVTHAMTMFSNVGLAMLFFFAGYEMDLRRIAGLPLRLGLAGWIVSLALAYSAAGVLAWAGMTLSVLYAGSALATTAIGTLIPILSDAGEMRTRFGAFLLAAGAAGELGPILLLTLILSTQSTLHETLILIAFLLLVLAVAAFAVRSSSRTLPVLERTLEASSQVAVRWVLVLVFGLALLAYNLGLDLLLGGFAAGMIAREMLRGDPLPGFESKLSAVSFGVFVPFFFVVSGMALDVTALFSSVAAVLRIVAFFVLLLVVRGTPALLLYRRVLDSRDRRALALMSSTQLPLVLAITTLATAAGQMSAAVAASLVGAAVLSTLAFPMLGLRVREGAHAQHRRRQGR